MRSCNSYQDIKTPEDYEEEISVEGIFDSLCEQYSDEIEEYGMDSYQRASLMCRARKIYAERESAYNEGEFEE